MLRAQTTRFRQEGGLPRKSRGGRSEGGTHRVSASWRPDTNIGSATEAAKQPREDADLSGTKTALRHVTPGTRRLPSMAHLRAFEHSRHAVSTAPVFRARLEAVLLICTAI